MRQTKTLTHAATDRVADKFLIETGVDLRLYPDALAHVFDACDESIHDLLQNGRADIVLPCIVRIEKQFLHLDVTLFLDEIQRREGC